MDITSLLTSAVVSALIAGLVTLRSTERRIQIENITQERAKWREKIRSNALSIHRAAVAKDITRLAELKLVFGLLLNPIDPEDQAILTSISDLQAAKDPQVCLTEFSERISFLLKHDWERAKHEAKPWFTRGGPPERQRCA